MPMNNNRRRNFRSRPQKNNFRRRNGSMNSNGGNNFNNGNMNFNRNGSMTNPHNVEKTMQKFQQLAKDAQSNGDPVLVENYLQHADHYSRRLAELNERNKNNSTIEKNTEIESLSKNLCMHIAAMKPESIDIIDLDKEFISKEEKIQKDLILNSGKPSNIADKILEGKMKKFYSEITLLNQSYILDQDQTVRKIIDQYSKFDFKIISFELISL